MTAVLVIGSAGYIGQRVVRALAARGIGAVGADIRTGPGLAEHRVDLAFPAQSFALVHAIRPDVVINLAYILSAAIEADPQRGIETNIAGVNGLFEACVRLRVPRLVFASSGSVFGDQSMHGNLAVTEETPLPPARTLYQLMKQLNERMAEHYNAAGVTELVSFRISSPHGGGRAHGFNPFDRLVGAARAGAREVHLPWRAEHGFVFNHVDDCAEAGVELALRPSLRWRVYNLGGETMTVAGLAAIAADRSGVRATFDPHGDPARYIERIASPRLEAELPFRRSSAADWFAREATAVASIRGGGAPG